MSNRAEPWWMNPDPVDFGPTVVLEQFKLGAFIESTIEYAVREPNHDFFTRDRLRYELTAWVLGKRLPPLTTHARRTFTVDVPASWWQHWKLAHQHTPLIGRVIRRWSPPRLAQVGYVVALTGSVERAALFPEASHVPQDAHLGRPVVCVIQPTWEMTPHTTQRNPPLW